MLKKALFTLAIFITILLFVGIASVELAGKQEAKNLLRVIFLMLFVIVGIVTIGIGSFRNLEEPSEPDIRPDDMPMP